jgi:protein required for attachment to host cells
MKSTRTLILVADDETARFFVNDGVGKGLREIAGLTARQFADAKIAYMDAPGRSSAGPGGMAKHGFDPHATADEEGRANFAGYVLQALETEWTQAKPDQLVIAASPKMLGVLRPRLSGAPAKALLADLAKDLVNIPLPDLPKHFAKIIAL